MTELPEYIAKCCREWIVLFGGAGRCGKCGQRPAYERPNCCPESYHHFTGRVQCSAHPGAHR